MHHRVVFSLLAAFAVARAAAFSCDVVDDPTEGALTALESAFRMLERAGWSRERGIMQFTHDVNDDADISEYGYPGAMLYARPSFAGGLSPVFRLGPSDALVITICTPPPTRYFGLSTYVWRRQGISLPTSRVVSATCSNNHVNSRTMRSGYPSFDEPMVLVSTGDAATFDVVSDAYVSAGVPKEALNLEALPIDRVNFGRSIISDRADELTFSFRVYDSNTREYAKRTWSSVMILRSPRGGSRFIRPIDPIAVKSPLPPQQIPTDESRLKFAADILGSSIEDQLVAAGFKLTKRGTMTPVSVDRDRCLTDGGYSPFRVAGASNINIRSGCFGETSDCTYAISSHSISADVPFIAVFVGADHVKLGNAEFSNLAAYHTGGALSFVSAAAVRVAAFADDRMWTRNDSSGLFAHAFASPGLCETFDEGSDISCVEVPTAAGDERIFIGRSYVDPSTGTAPNAEQLLPINVDYFAPP